MSRHDLKDILYLVHRFPYPPDKGDRIRALNIIRYLHPRCRLHVATLADEPIPADDKAALVGLCTRLGMIQLHRSARWLRAAKSLAGGKTASEGAFRSRRFRALVRRWSRVTRFDAVLISASSMAPYLSAPGLHGVPVVADLVDVDSEKWSQYAQAATTPRQWLYLREARRLRRLEQAIGRRAQAVTFVSEAEAALYCRFSPDARVVAVPNGVDLEYFQPGGAAHATPGESLRQNPVEQTGTGPARLMFLGALNYRPNIEGVRWFCRMVWPALRQRRPDLVFTIVGRRPVADVQDLERLPGVAIVPDVPDVRPWLSGADAVVAPLQIARGIQNKVLEAMAMARPVIASPEALAGLAVQPGTHVLAAASPDEWVVQIDRLLPDVSLRQSLSAAARTFVERHHCWDQQLQPLGRLLGCLADADDVPRINCQTVDLADPNVETDPDIPVVHDEPRRSAVTSAREPAEREDAARQRPAPHEPRPPRPRSTSDSGVLV